MPRKDYSFFRAANLKLLLFIQIGNSNTPKFFFAKLYLMFFIFGRYVFCMQTKKMFLWMLLISWIAGSLAFLWQTEKQALLDGAMTCSTKVN
jgi:hypothetical protein